MSAETPAAGWPAGAGNASTGTSSRARDTACIRVSSSRRSSRADARSPSAAPRSPSNPAPVSSRPDQGRPAESAGVCPGVRLPGVSAIFIGDLGWKPCPSGRGGNFAWPVRLWLVVESWTRVSGGPPHDPAKDDGDQERPPIPARLTRPAKSCRNRRHKTPLRELTSGKSATFGRYWTSRWTWSCSPLDSARAASNSAHTCALTCSHRSSISVSNTPRRYAVTTTRRIRRSWTTGRPRLEGSGSRRGVVGRRYVGCHEAPLVSERCTEGAPVGAVRTYPVCVEPWFGAAPDVAAVTGTHAGFQRPGRPGLRGSAQWRPPTAHHCRRAGAAASQRSWPARHIQGICQGKGVPIEGRSDDRPLHAGCDQASDRLDISQGRHSAGGDHGTVGALPHLAEQLKVGTLKHSVLVDVGHHVAGASLSVKTLEGFPEVTARLRPAARCQGRATNVKPDGNPVAVLGNGRGGPVRILQRCRAEVHSAAAALSNGCRRVNLGTGGLGDPDGPAA